MCWHDVQKVQYSPRVTFIIQNYFRVVNSLKVPVFLIYWSGLGLLAPLVDHTSGGPQAAELCVPLSEPIMRFCWITSSSASFHISQKTSTYQLSCKKRLTAQLAVMLAQVEKVVVQLAEVAVQVAVL